MDLSWTERLKILGLDYGMHVMGKVFISWCIWKPVGVWVTYACVDRSVLECGEVE